MCDEGSKAINEQASYAATKLRQLYDKLEYKRQALGSIQNAPKPDKKVESTPKVHSLWHQTHKHNIEIGGFAHPHPSYTMSSFCLQCQDVTSVVEGKCDKTLYYIFYYSF